MDGILNTFQSVLLSESHILELYLNGIRDHLGFSTQTSSIEDVVQNISSNLAKSNTRPLGLKLLGIFLQQCSITVLEPKFALWTSLVLKACNAHELEENSVLIFQTLEHLGRRAQQSPELTKLFVSNYITKIFDTLTSVPANGHLAALHCIETYLRLYPGSSGPSKVIIERYLLRFIDTLDKEVTSCCGKCLHLLQQIRCGGAPGTNPKQQWKYYQLQLIGSIRDLFNEMFSKCAKIHDDNIVQERLIKDKFELSHEPIKRIAQLYIRCSNLIQYLIIALREPYPVGKPFMPKKILDLLIHGLSITCLDLQQEPITDNLALGILIPNLHGTLLELLDNLIITLQSNLRSHTELILGIYMDMLRWTSFRLKSCNQKPLVTLRAKVYDSISLWCKVLYCGSRCETVADFLVKEIVNDIRPIQKEFTLRVLCGSRKHLSKNARRQLYKAQNEESKVSHTHISEEGNQPLCIAALHCLQEVLQSTANFLKPTLIKLIQMNVVQICGLFYIRPLKEVHLYYNPVCRLEILKALYILLIIPHHLCPPPFQIALNTFQTAYLRDGNLEIRKQCGLILQNMEEILHPQKSSLLFPIEIRDVRNAFGKLDEECVMGEYNMNSTTPEHCVEANDKQEACSVLETLPKNTEITSESTVTSHAAAQNHNDPSEEDIADNSISLDFQSRSVNVSDSVESREFSTDGSIEFPFKKKKFANDVYTTENIEAHCQKLDASKNIPLNDVCNIDSIQNKEDSQIDSTNFESEKYSITHTNTNDEQIIADIEASFVDELN